MSLPGGFVDELKNRVHLAEVIGKTVKLTRRGRQFLGLCPFHGEKTPSFHVYEDHYHCFGCGAHGSVIDFVMQAEKIGFADAVERLAALAGMRVPLASPEAAERDRRRGSLYELLEAATRYYQQMLRMPEGKPALDYLRRRGVGEGEIERFRLGYAPAGRFAVKSAMTREGFGEEAMIEAGLLVSSQDPSQSAYDRFRGRVIYPIGDRRGRIIGFGGRLLGAGEPKYLNSPETPLFRKGSLLYNWVAGTTAARDAGTVIVVEGYMDVIGLAGAGWQNVVAPLGTALTEDQLLALWALVPEPILLFDADAAGDRAALRAAERALPLLKPGLGLRFASLMTGAGDDPDTVARRYPRQMLHRTVMEAVALSDFLVLVASKERRLDTAESIAALEDRLMRYASQIADGQARRRFQQSFRDRVRRTARRGDRRQAWARPSSVSLQPSTHRDGWRAHDPRNRAERVLIAILLNHPEFFHEVEDEFGAIEFSDRELDQLRQDVVDVLSGSAVQEDAPRLAAMLTERCPGDAICAVLNDPLIRSHRLIAPYAALADVRATWKENAVILSQPKATEAADTKAGSRPGALARKLAHRRLALDDGAE